MSKILFKNCKVVDTSNEKIVKSDVLIEDGVILDALPSIDLKDVEIIDCNGNFLIPGLVDMHAHLREPGDEYKEDIRTGTMAAIHGGYVALVSMPNTNPPCDNRSVVEYILRRSKEEGNADVFPCGTITKRRQGEELAELADMAEGGAIAFSDDGSWVQSSGVMRRALEYSKFFGGIIISHPEDRTLTVRGVANESPFTIKLGLRGMPEEAETIAIFRDIELARLTKGRLHIAHVSSKGNIELIKLAKASGLNVTAEVTPHHLIFDEESLSNYDPVYKVNPPLRTRDDRHALLEALKDGVIDIIATDHAPHADFEKMDEFNSAPFGMIWLDLAFVVLYNELVVSGGMDLVRLTKVMSTRPAELLKLEGLGAIEKGYKASFFAFNPEAEITINREFIKSRAFNTPLYNSSMRGKVEWTVKDGKIYRF
ncbi:MAG TPA: dihydroorotase [Candidatus Hydrothermia bacterium]|nr:dihydroorotase [Candidatus Hydrothermae bacterium]MDD3649816.1 dihydroorotase [Candidatus Hydrothermia bacterium]HOK23398.1 dihydroorotase [Candidatus Hydrothermia bacterium]HOL24208.1 dihydroorotase [Candidatus Hydrothermia bacterium]HOP32015.1 dihydroorotase [Candidatus Hydrothermia bacterium]